MVAVVFVLGRVDMGGGGGDDVAVVAGVDTAFVGRGDVDEHAPAWPEVGIHRGARWRQWWPHIVDGGGGGERKGRTVTNV